MTNLKSVFKQMSTMMFASVSACSLMLFGCDDFLQVDLPQSKTAIALVFSDSIIATSAVTGIYVDMLDNDNFASGSNQSITAVAGLSADELVNYPQDQNFMAFQENTLSPTNASISTLWNSFYKIIYEANAAIEGLNKSKLTESVRNRLTGECLFIRGFCYFYLVNTFGPVPISLTSDYQTNSKLSRSSVDLVYDQIINDLKLAQSLLPDKYLTSARIRPNKGAATAMLARVYLYTSQWEEAIVESSKVIQSDNYRLEDLNAVFLTSSNEAIWQLGNILPNFNTHEGEFFVINGAVQYNILRSDFIERFESGDNRLNSWVGTFDTGSEILYYPYKYKKFATIDVEQGEEVTEYSMVLRLAEQYLIRAESRAKLSDLSGAIEDLDTIRARAGLPGIADENPGIDQSGLLDIVTKERQIEFFAEWGHRWYDLKRWDTAAESLSSIKADWNEDDVLYPIPQDEFARNPQLGLQNKGY